MDLLQGIIPDHWLAALTLAVTLCAAITTLLLPPTENSPAMYRVLYQVLQWVAMNLGRARNAQDQGPAKTIPQDGKR